MALDLLATHKELMDALKEIDKQLDSLDGGNASAKTEVTNALIEAAKPNWSVVSEGILSQLADLSEDEQVGFYFGLIREFDKKFSDPARKAIESKVEALPKQEPLISTDKVPEVTEQRKEVYARIKAIMDLAEVFGSEEFAQMDKPRRRGGAPKGKRGPRAITFVTWTRDDDKEFEDLKAIVEAYPQYSKVKELADAIKVNGQTTGADKKGVNLTDPPAEFTFDLPDGKVLTGVNSLKNQSEEDEEEEVDSEEEA